MKLRACWAGAAALVMGLTSLVAATGPTTAGAAAAKSPAPKPTRAASAGTVYPYSFMQPNGIMATVDAPPTRIVVVDNPEYGVSMLAALGVQPIGGLLYPENEPGIAPGFQGVHLTSFKQLGTAPNGGPVSC